MERTKAEMSRGLEDVATLVTFFRPADQAPGGLDEPSAEANREHTRDGGGSTCPAAMVVLPSRAWDAPWAFRQLREFLKSRGAAGVGRNGVECGRPEKANCARDSLWGRSEPMGQLA